MSITALVVTVVVVTILLPIVPAYLLFKAIPSTGDVTGRLQGLEFKLGGAFAGYFIVVVLILSQLNNIKNIVLDPDQVWTVDGRVLDEHGRGIDLATTDLSLTPPPLAPEKSGYFKVKFATSPMEGGNGKSFPRLYVVREGYIQYPVALGPTKSVDQHDRDESLHNILLNDIRLEKVPVSLVPPAPKATLAYPPASALPNP
jgi:hypothetical protein